MCGLAKQCLGDILCNTRVKTVLADSSKETAKTNYKKTGKVGVLLSKGHRMAVSNSCSLGFSSKCSYLTGLHKKSVRCPLSLLFT